MYEKVFPTERMFSYINDRFCMYVTDGIRRNQGSPTHWGAEKKTQVPLASTNKKSAPI